MNEYLFVIDFLSLDLDRLHILTSARLLMQSTQCWVKWGLSGC